MVVAVTLKIAMMMASLATLKVVIVSNVREELAMVAVVIVNQEIAMVKEVEAKVSLKRRTTKSIGKRFFCSQSTRSHSKYTSHQHPLKMKAKCLEQKSQSVLISTSFKT